MKPRVQLMARIAISAFLALVLPGWTQPGENVLRFAESTETAKKPVDALADADVDKEMDVGRYYLGRRNHIGALNRFKFVVTRFQTSPRVEEALARITEIYLALGIGSEAQTAVAVLQRKFPNGDWAIGAHDALKSTGLDPAEDEKSWISRTFK